MQGVFKSWKNTGAGAYRYGFNGKENDNDVKGIEGGQQDYGMRIYNPRLGRFLSEDPLSKSFSMLTPYQFASNTPIAAIDLDGLEAKIVTTYSYTDSKGTLVKKTSEEDVKNPYNLGKGVLNISIHYKNEAPNTEASTIAKYTPQSFMSKASEINLWFGDRKNEFGFVLSGNSNGTSVNIGSDGVQFKENLDIGVLLKVMGAVRDVTDQKSTITDFLTNKRIKGLYNIIKSSMKVGEALLPKDDKVANESPTTTSNNSAVIDNKPDDIIVIKKPFNSKDNTLWPDTLESRKTSNGPDAPDTIFKTPIIKR